MNRFAFSLIAGLCVLPIGAAFSNTISSVPLVTQTPVEWFNSQGVDGEAFKNSTRIQLSTSGDYPLSMLQLNFGPFAGWFAWVSEGAYAGLSDNYGEALEQGRDKLKSVRSALKKALRSDNISESTRAEYTQLLGQINDGIKHLKKLIKENKKKERKARKAARKAEKESNDVWLGRHGENGGICDQPYVNC